MVPPLTGLLLSCLLSGAGYTLPDNAAGLAA